MIPAAWETTYAALQPYVKWKDSGGRFCQQQIFWHTAPFYTDGNFVTANGLFHVYQLSPGLPGNYPAVAFSYAANLRTGAVTMQFGMGPAGCHAAGECLPATGRPSLNVTLTNLP